MLGCQSVECACSIASAHVHAWLPAECTFGLQAERQRLDGMRLRWLAEVRRKQKARGAERRAAAAAENAKHKEKTDNEDVLVKYA